MSRLIPLALVLLLLGACVPDYTQHAFRGVLYADSTLTATVPDVELAFRESTGSHGRCLTDAQGRWGFSYVRNLDNPNTEPKFQFAEHSIVITWGTDTVYYYDHLPYGSSTNDTVDAFPGYMDYLRARYYHTDTIPTTDTTDTTAL